MVSMEDNIRAAGFVPVQCNHLIHTHQSFCIHPYHKKMQNRLLFCLLQSHSQSDKLNLTPPTRRSYQTLLPDAPTRRSKELLDSSVRAYNICCHHHNSSSSVEVFLHYAPWLLHPTDSWQLNSIRIHSSSSSSWQDELISRCSTAAVCCTWYLDIKILGGQMEKRSNYLAWNFRKWSHVGELWPASRNQLSRSR